jgi:hypothetical protein
VLTDFTTPRAVPAAKVAAAPSGALAPVEAGAAPALPAATSIAPTIHATIRAPVVGIIHLRASEG